MMKNSSKPVRTLIVEDNPLTARLIEDFLRLDSLFQVVGTAHSGEEALELAACCQPDLVLMDVEMPGIDGLEATKRLLAVQPGLHVIIVSVHEGTEVRALAFKNGACGFVAKNRLVEELRVALERVGMREKPEADSL